MPILSIFARNLSKKYSMYKTIPKQQKKLRFDWNNTEITLDKTNA